MESSLNLLYQQIQGEVGEFLGYGRGPVANTDNSPPVDSTWNQAQLADINFCVASGLRCFYFPPPIDGSTASFEWSFLHPTATLVLASGKSTIDLPDDFGGFEGPLTISTTPQVAMPWFIEWRNEGALRQMYSVQPTSTGPPMYAAQIPLKGTTATQSNRFQLLIFPLSDQAYTLQAQYYINPDFLSGAFPYAYGGVQHAETILTSCLAIAEQRRDDAMSVQSAKFKERLAASISMDRRLKPQSLGYNSDRSDRRGWTRQDVHFWQPAATYNGSSF